MITERNRKRKAFTIVELLTVMSIIVILFSLLVPAMTMVRRYAKQVKQNAQFHAIHAALQMFNNDYDYFPDSDRYDGDGSPGTEYNGAMKLAEAMVGMDKMGFHPDSSFYADGQTADGNDLYFPQDNLTGNQTEIEDNIRSRTGPYLPLDGANGYYIGDLYGQTNINPFQNPAVMPTSGTNLPSGPLVLCDEYKNVRNTRTGKRVGMPVLYFKADSSNISNYFSIGTDAESTDQNNNIYDLRDNIDLIGLEPPFGDGVHEIADGQNPQKFYEMIKDEGITSSAATNTNRPHRPDTYILMSAGHDGIYGTDDDVFNFQK